MKRIALLVMITLVGIVLLYFSRFWFLDLWPRSGLFGVQELRPGGGLLEHWLRGTPLASFELLIWGTFVFLFLTYLQRFIDFILPAPTPEKDDQNGS